MSDTMGIDDVFGSWRDALERGQERSPSEICPNDPELAAELARRIEEWKRQNTGNRSAAAPTASLLATEARPPVAPAAKEVEFEGQLSARIDFQKIRHHGQGGLGIVYLAMDRQLHRDVAVKMLRCAGQDSFQLQSELVQEAEITGKLEHPGVVPVYCIGECDDGRPFYVMRFIRGETFDAAINRYHKPVSPRPSEGERNIEFRSLLGRFLSVCNTVAYAHNRGVIHRDIKPENVMLGKFGETLLVDWGLAMLVDRDSHAHASGEASLRLGPAGESGNSSARSAGTPAYMSPEQAEGVQALTRATDIYSLGATLYKLITGKLPCKGKNVSEVLENVKKGVIEPPIGAPKPLAQICLKAMAFQPENRYPTAKELAEDIEQWLADEPVSVLSESRVARVRRWLRRHRGVAFASAIGLMSALAVSVLAVFALSSSKDRERMGREQNLRHVAQFASRLMATEIELRWRILEHDASQPKVIELLERINATDDPAARSDIQDWLNQRHDPNDPSELASARFIDDRKGRLVALSGRFPKKNIEKNLLRSFQHRDYFHGQDRYVEPNPTQDVKPIVAPYLSRAYESTTDRRLKVAFSVPIRNGDEVIGVMAMTAGLDTFKALVTVEDPAAILIDSRADFLDGPEGKPGLVLHHKHFEELDPKESEVNRPRVSPEMVERFQALASHRTKLSKSPPDNFDRSYFDPVFQSKGWMTAFEPVIVPGVDGRGRATGWVVLVQGK